ncbi:MAG: hypothetical protein JEZ05_01835 [Tenericutes bacterium]|nr:hypothetical protein [Mycoplasmatota bacterium]
MFKILQDSIFNPKGLVKQVNRSGWFVLLYLIVMALFMSIGNTITYVSYENPVINDETTGCSLVDNSIVCDGENYDINALFFVYGIRVYFINEDATVDDIPNMELNALVVQDDTVGIYLNKSFVGALSIFSADYGFTTLAAAFSSVLTTLLIASLVSNFIMNLILILGVTLVSTIMFSRYRKFIKYKKLFKLTVFAVTPVVLLITFFNMLQFDMIIFFILSLVAYRTLFSLNRHLYMQMTLRAMQQNHRQNPDDKDVVEIDDEDDLDDLDKD